MADLDDLYSEYVNDPTPDNLSKVVGAAEPVINYALSSVNAHGSPTMKSRARIFAASAVKTYNPIHGANLRTWIGNNLLQLRRAQREESTPVRVPERTQLDMTHVHRVTQKFVDENGRDPDTMELADATGFSMDKLEKLRRSYRPVVAESAFDGNSPSSIAPDYGQEALDYIYADADHADRKIIEHLTGYKGAEILPAQAIAAKVKLHPSQISRRATRLSMEMEKIIQQLEKA